MIIEGATVNGEALLLFQRGNGKGAVNAVISLSLGEVRGSLTEGRIDAAAVHDIRRHDMGEVDGVRLCFSDATALADGRVLFTAVAEGGEDTYHDGACASSGIGVLDARGDLAGWDQLVPAHQVEGIEAHEAAGGIGILLVADPDDASAPSPLLAARL